MERLSAVDTLRSNGGGRIKLSESWKWEVSSPGSVSLPASSKESKTPQIKKGGVPFNEGEKYMTIELINQYQSQGKLS